MAEAMRDRRQSHLDRTAAEPRNPSLHTVVLSDILLVGQTIRLLHLQIHPGDPDIQFLPGQWIDTFCPGLPKAGGFTITSAPSRALSRPEAGPRFIELAVRQSSENPAAEWLWQPAAAILGETLQVRVGGSFVFPPSLGGAPSSLAPARFIFVAGGVGINPLMSMLSHIGELHDAVAGEEAGPAPFVDVLYSSREEGSLQDQHGSPASRILFLDRLASLYSKQYLRGKLQLFLTGGSATDEPSGVLSCGELDVPYVRRRIATTDLDAAVLGGLKGEDKSGISIIDRTYVYVCGVPDMTDAFVGHLTAPSDSGRPGLPSSNVLFEKWW